MTSESKILTVSYGTFSCTLEGFDNPFDTMKAIAEYFRDLAAQDRHFGAEPPPPDAAMLHRLAEREVSRLAAGKLDDAARLKTADAAEGPAPRIQINPVLRRSAPPVEAEAPEMDAPEAPEPSLTDVIPDGVAAKLARIRRAVNPSVPLAETAFSADPDLSVAAEVEAGGETAFAESAYANDAGDVAARLGALISSDPVAALDDLADLPDGAADAGTDEDELVSFAAESATDAGPDATALPILDDLDETGLPSLQDHPVETDFTSDDVALPAQLDGAALDEATLTATLADDTLPEDQPVALDITDAALQDPLPEAVTEELSADPLPAAMDTDVAVAPAAAPERSDDQTTKPGGRTRRVNSRVVRIHPSQDLRDPGATRVLDAGDDSSEVARLMQQADEVMADEENRRRHEALSRLKAAVVATEADRADVDYEAPKADANLDPYRGDLAEAIQPTPEPQPQPEPEVKPSRRKSVVIRPTEPRPGTIRPGMISPPPLVLVSEQRIDRVGPAASPAPAPTPAPAAAPQTAPTAPGIGPSEGQPMVALRTGRLSGAIGAGAAVAASSTPARNLVLEKPSYGPAAEADDDEDLAEDAKEINEAGLAAFADTVGARSMAEMLEAAAAYATCVEKRSQFTRPQLMRRMVASAGGKPVSREDGLRSFGTLLRTGRIEKVTRGHYCLAENSPYLAEARRLS